MKEIKPEKIQKGRYYRFQAGTRLNTAFKSVTFRFSVQDGGTTHWKLFQTQLEAKLRKDL